MSFKAKAYWLAIVVAGTCCIGGAAMGWQIRSENLLQFCVYLVAAVAASGLKIKLPGILGTLSMNYLVIIVSLLELQLASAILIGVASVLAQVLIRPRANPTWQQVVFSAFRFPFPWPRRMASCI